MKDPDKEDKFFFLLSGENPELAVFEFKSIISTLDIPLNLKVSSDNRVMNLHILPKNGVKNTSEVLSYLMERLTLVHFCCSHFFQVEFKQTPPESFNELISNHKITVVQDLTPSKSFSVITKRIGEPLERYKPRAMSLKLSRYLGAQIIKQNPTKQVNLDDPQEKFIAILSKHGLWFGKLISYSLRKDVQQRAAHKRPFFHPSSMNPLLQRTMVNLAAIKPNEWMLDPFCGTGGALIEASRLEIRSVGIEINPKILWGAYQNLKVDRITKDLADLIFGDAIQLPFRMNSISAIVTDPPYGTASSTRGFDLQDLLLDFFRAIRYILTSNARVVIAVPSYLKIEDNLAQILDASYVKFLHYVHRSLTRKILVFSLP
ncbi:MAG: N-6 DNA methylase [Candidatus Heimdallarchaeota archaeon]|nr:MAG: N-6 DNA methylase [Candidatus Heimdallarchaeota archaeon]